MIREKEKGGGRWWGSVGERKYGMERLFECVFIFVVKVSIGEWGDFIRESFFFEFVMVKSELEVEWN